MRSTSNPVTLQRFSCVNQVRTRPEPESYDFNRLLYMLRMSADERRRFVLDMDTMCGEYQLRAEEITAVKSFEPLTVPGLAHTRYSHGLRFIWSQPICGWQRIITRLKAARNSLLR